RSRAAELRRRAPRCSVHLKTRNALVARVGLLGLLAQDHGLVAAVERTRCRLEAERGTLREAEPGRSSQDRCDHGHCGDTSLHGHPSAPPMRPQRTSPLFVPGDRFFRRQRSSPDGQYALRTTPRFRLVARSFVPTAADLAPASPASRSPRQSRASCAWPRDRSFGLRGRALPRRAPASAWDRGSCGKTCRPICRRWFCARSQSFVNGAVLRLAGWPDLRPEATGEGRASALTRRRAVIQAKGLVCAP